MYEERRAIIVPALPPPDVVMALPNGRGTLACREKVYAEGEQAIEDSKADIGMSF
jgi:hypothetical protein